MKNQSIYAKAIQIYSDYGKKDNGLHNLLTEILKSTPSAIVKADKAINGVRPYQGLNSVNAEALFISREEGKGKIHAIKFLRGKLKIGLKEAKDHFEKLQYENP